MPHATIEGPVRVADYVNVFQPSIQKRGDEIIRFLDILLNHERNRAVVETVVVEAGRSVRFFIEVRDREDGVHVRLEPLTDPEKTPGVKRSVALVARGIRSLSNECKFGSANLGEFLQSGEGDSV